MPTDLSRPLDDAEIAELDELLSALPESQDALDVSMLDGFLAGVLLQPKTVPSSSWLPLVFDAQGHAGEPATGSAALERASELILRRHAELAAYIVAREAFEPIIFEVENEDGSPPSDQDAIDALEPWATGFLNALSAFPELVDLHGDDPDVGRMLMGVLRHLPMDPEDDSEGARRLVENQEEYRQEFPLADLDEAMEEMALAVLDLADVVRPREPQRRADPKVGRNDPCPCGSGKKFKQCHGRDPR